MKNIVVILFFTSIILQGFTQTKEVPFTLDDRDRIIRTEQQILTTNEKITSLRNEMNAKFEAINIKFDAMDSKFESIDSRFEAIDTKFDAMDAKFDAMDAKFDAMDAKFDAIDSKIGNLNWGFAILITIMLCLFGFILWDRRTALAPFQNKTINLENRVEKMENAYREQAKHDPAFAKILKHIGLL